MKAKWDPLVAAEARAGGVVGKEERERDCRAAWREKARKERAYWEKWGREGRAHETEAQDISRYLDEGARRRGVEV